MRMPAANANAVAVAVTVPTDSRPAAASDSVAVAAAAVAAAAASSTETAAPGPASASVAVSNTHRPASDEAATAAAASSASVAVTLPPLSHPQPHPHPPLTSLPSMPLTLSLPSRHDAALTAGRLEPYSFGAHHHPLPPPSTYYRRLAAAPGPALGPVPAPAASPSSSAARYGPFGFPPSPSPTPSHPKSFNSSLSSHDRNHSGSSFASTGNSNHVTSAPRSDTSKPGRCSVMALQNVLCDPDDDVDMASSRSSHPPTPPLDALNRPITHSAPVSPASAPLETPTFTGIPRPNPSHVVMTTRPQLHAPHIQHTEPGCKTCQIRKMPCDEGRPSCQNCSRMGIHCLGYFSPSHANAQQASDRSVPSVSANAKRQDQEEYLFFLLDHYRHTKRHCMWELITLDFNEHFSCNMRKEALQMIKRRRFKDKDTREASPNDAPTPPQRPKAKRGRRPRSSAPSLQPLPQEAGNEPGTG